MVSGYLTTDWKPAEFIEFLNKFFLYYYANHYGHFIIRLGFPVCEKKNVIKEHTFIRKTVLEVGRNISLLHLK